MTGYYQQLTYEHDPAMIIVIEAKLRIEWSPEQVLGWLLYDRRS
ncbi:MAG: hypothetical protein QS748_05580 [Candidatus Endonucleobacter bathymodioli]|uniref:Uncharacterized protein n=1 Tax=Candidatus Endonucleibacter bathymodioli TaxID=539814 RepID=A0AA90NL28_9GAMM|nr:hypothetical protein [Candidatus Endonucleobacter bathymodioli]